MRYTLLMFFRCLFKNQQGSSYVQIILASTAIAGLALVGLKMAQDQKKLALDIYRKYLMNYLHQEVTYFLSQDKNCQRSLIAQKYGSLDIPGLKKSGSAKIIYFSPKDKVAPKEVVYFEEPVYVKGYELVSDSNPNSYQLKVSYGLGDQSIDKFIPLKVNLDNSNLIADCTVIAQGSNSVSRGPWKKEGDVIKTKFKNIIFGSDSLTLEGTVLLEGLFLEGESDLTTCDTKSIGVVKYIRGRGIRYCKDNTWYPFGNQPLRTNTQISYALGVNKIGSEEIITKKHRHCFISKLKKDVISDGCKLRRIDSKVMSQFEVKAYTSEAATSMECEVTCVD